MAYRLGLIIMALSASLAGCTNSLTDAVADELDGAGAGTTGSGGGARDVDGGQGEPSADADTETETETSGYGSSGSVDEGSGFGMSDDVPLVVAIPDVKQGLVVAGTWVVIQQVPPTTGRAILGSHEWFYVQDPQVSEYMGLRIELPTGFDSPDFERWLDLEGYVRDSEHGWVLELEDAIGGTLHDDLSPISIDADALWASDAATLDDALVELDTPDTLQVLGVGSVPGVVLVRDTIGGEVLQVDLRPFDLEELPLWAGLRLQRLVGVAELGNGRPTLLPRSPDDVVIGG